MARLKSDRIIGTGVVLAAGLGLAHLSLWLACGAGILMVATILPPVGVALLLRAISRGHAGRAAPVASSRSLPDGPRVVL
ncbi:MAG TPA: hypothetical protein VI456_08430, partial [Polyangia bacterium]